MLRDVSVTRTVRQSYIYIGSFKRTEIDLSSSARRIPYGSAASLSASLDGPTTERNIGSRLAVVDSLRRSHENEQRLIIRRESRRES